MPVVVQEPSDGVCGYAAIPRELGYVEQRTDAGDEELLEPLKGLRIPQIDQFPKIGVQVCLMIAVQPLLSIFGMLAG